jgi:ATPase subunit of ABC transporter with duplicated ATPase domains
VNFLVQVGENGAGKTTLLKILLGELEVVSGIRHCHRNLRMGYFSQHHVDQLDMNLTSVGLMQSRFSGMFSVLDSVTDQKNDVTTRFQFIIEKELQTQISSLDKQLYISMKSYIS